MHPFRHVPRYPRRHFVQRRNLIQRVSKSLNFGRKEEPLLLPRPADMPAAPQVPVVLQFVQKPLVENVISDGECEGNICKVQAIITFESGRKTGDLPKELHRLGKALARGSNFKALADAAMDSPNLRKAIEERVCADISKECKILCSKGNPSMLRGATKETVLNFSWHTVGKEIQEKCPFSIAFFWPLQIQMHTKRKMERIPQQTKENPGICTAAAILLKNRDKGMSLVPYILSCVLKMGRTSKMAFVRLNKLGITMSPKSINKALDLLGLERKVTDHLEKCCQLKQEKSDIEARKGELEQQADLGDDMVHPLGAAKTALSNLEAKLMN
ncbi:hypothetical protein OS493_007111 [Desmophyllum pertusum]|uniref:Uncharacterized protein n=1 Tax=Desmophyllum pertusum TaxID=174260 RepID=A0A9W9ZHP8_9CNID|nr:hypothetical protein OS493_007111 [Desmophyllum pertusum]